MGRDTCKHTYTDIHTHTHFYMNKQSIINMINILMISLSISIKAFLKWLDCKSVYERFA